MDEERIVIGQPRPALLKEQKVGLSFVIVCGVGALVLGSLYLWRHMAVPFVIEYEGPRLLVGEEEESAEIAKAKATDTDNDSISDYDEKYIYKTSAYIADSDSDGLNDDVEITSGQDPNCATGDKCDTIVQDEDALRDEGVNGTFVDDIEPPTPPVVPAGLDGTASVESNPSLSAEDLTKLQNLSTAEVKKLLIDSGADAQKVNGLSDAEIDALYQEILSSLSSANP